jgi:[glutamine synthetase] adenylyltransferase / [glutamine synthetase]-adenylyl-L-tyrosine phosphorylase
VEEPAQRFVDALRGGRADAAPLRAAGAPDPESAAGAFAHAAKDPDLAPHLEAWVPELLAAARPGFGAQCLEELARRAREAGTPLDLPGHPALPRLLGCSNFLARLLLRHPEWSADVAGTLPVPPCDAPPAPDWSAIRTAKYRGLLRVAARDLAGRDFAEGLRELSDLADRCLAAALACAAAETGVAAPALFALGKLGGRELNFSSDVDVLFVYEVPAGSDAFEQRQAMERLVQRFKSGLEEPTEEGFAYRVDLDLRPEGPGGVLANSVDAALSYYETFGAEWERQMLIRLRPVAGPFAVADGFARAIAPFVYRRLIDPGVLTSVRDMKSRIEDERRRAGRDLEANLKEGPGGIRDVEFLVQSLQLFYGGRHDALRTGNVLDALAALARLGILPETTARALREAYLWLRRAEHSLQLAEEQQLQRFPRDAAGQLALARRMGYAEPGGEDARTRLLDDWLAVRSEVRAHFEELVLSPEA